MIFASVCCRKCSKLAESEGTQQHPLTPSFLGSNPSTPAQVTIYEINRCSERSEDALREAEPSLAFFMQGLHDRVSDYDTKGRVDLEVI